jgi:outer membrane murein-binding lipoprotein Lpp
MTSIDTEIATLHARIAQLEKEKNTLPPPTITPEKLLEERLKKAKNDNSRPKESPIATACRFSRASENEMLESIVGSLKTINSRIDMIESKMVIKEPSPSNEYVQLQRM